MTKQACIILAATLLSSGISRVAADQTNQSTLSTNSPAGPQPFSTLTPQQRAEKIEALRKAHGFTNAPANLTPQERRARIQKRIEELHRKQAEGTITPVETRQLELLQRSASHPLPSHRALTNNVVKPSVTNSNLPAK